MQSTLQKSKSIYNILMLYNYHQKSVKMKRVGFLGAGKMAQALAKGFIGAGLVKSEHIIASCAPQDLPCVEAFKSLGSKTTFKNEEVVKNSDVIILAVKPNVVPAVLADIKQFVPSDSLLLSIAMGVTLQTLENNLKEKAKVIRVMPNTPALIQQGVSVFVPGSYTTEEDVTLTNKLLSSVGTCDQAPEYLLDVVTALSGSGPAYALADGAVRMGMSREMALKLAAKTVSGAAQMVLSTGDHPAKLRDDVTSPAGSTAEGLFTLESFGVRGAVIKTLQAATDKCRETSKQNK